MATADFSPEKIRSVVNRRGGFSTSDRFQISFEGGGDFLSTRFGKDADLAYLCENVALPTKSIAGVGKMIYGLEYQMPYRQSYPEVAMTFYCTRDMSEKIAFDEWQNLIVNPHTGDLSFHDDYTCNIKISKYAKDATDFSSTPVYSILLEKAWPSIVAEVQLTHSAGNEITRLPVTFQYKKWRPFTSNASTGRRFTPLGQGDPNFFGGT